MTKQHMGMGHNLQRYPSTNGNFGSDPIPHNLQTSFNTPIYYSLKPKSCTPNMFPPPPQTVVVLLLAVSESKKASSMERNSLVSSSLRGHSSNKVMMVQDPIRNQSCGEEEYNTSVGFSWPPRCYACSFCKREFRSAQALGGHMNVHRRDRARLRQSPPLSPHHHHHHLLNLNVSPSPNPNCSTSPSPSTLNGSLSCALTSPSSPAPDLNKCPLYSPSTLRAVKKSKFLKTSVGLSLEIGQVSHSKENLDLELRLGYP